MLVSIRRHAPTEGNLLSQYVGSSDQPLSREGVEMARSTSPRHGAGRVYTSSLIRTRMTAEILYPDAEIVENSLLDEMNFGRFEGRNWRELEYDDAYRKWLESFCEDPCPDGEDKEGFSRRCREAFAAILADEFAHGKGELHLVVHGGTIMAILSAFAEPKRQYFSWRTGFCGGFLLECRDPARARPLRLIEEISPYRSADGDS